MALFSARVSTVFCLFRYTPLARSTLTQVALPELYEAGKRHVQSLLEKSNSVSLTVDIWSDRVMRSYLGITAHVIVQQNDGRQPSEVTCNLQPLLLSFQRFVGPHSGENISSVFEEVLHSNDIKNKVDYIVTDNAANMKAAFETKFNVPLNNYDDQNLCDTEDEDDAMWEDLPDGDDQFQIEVILGSPSNQRLSCFAHTLQLVVGDGIKAISGSLAKSIAKVSRLSTLLHRSTIFKER